MSDFLNRRDFIGGLAAFGLGGCRSAAFGGGEARLRVVPAADARPEAQAFSAGVYDNGLKKGRCGVQRKSGEISDGEYAWYDLGEWTPGDTADKQYFWAATGYFNKQEPGAHSAVKAVYLDALRLSEM